MSSELFEGVINKRVSLDIAGMIYGATVLSFIDHDEIEERRITLAIRAARADKLPLMFSDKALMLFEQDDGHFVVGYLRYRTKRILDEDNVTMVFAIEKAVIREVGRQGFRVRLKGSCSFTQTIDAGDDIVTLETPAKLVDISETGLGVVTNSPLHPNSEAECHIEIEHAMTAFRCRVVFSRPMVNEDETTAFRCGLRFVDMSRQDQNMIAKYVRALQIKIIREEFVDD